MEHVPHLRTRRPAGRRGRRLSRRQLQGRQDRRRPRQDPVWPGPRRRNQEGAECRRRHRSHVRRHQCRRQGLLGAHRQDEGSRRFGRLLRRPAHRSRPDHAPARRPGPEGDLHVGRRHRVERACLDRRRRRQRHADDVRSGSAQEPGRQGARREVPCGRLRARSLHAVLLCRAAGRCRGGRQGRLRSTPQKVAETIKASGPWTTAIGDIGYDAKGDITRPDYVMYEWKKGDDGKYTYFEMAK